MTEVPSHAAVRAVLLGALGAFIIGATFIGGYEAGTHHKTDCTPNLTDLRTGKTCGLSYNERLRMKYGAH